MAIVTFLLPFVYVVMIVFYPISYPVSRILDYFLGHEEEGAYNRVELRTMLRIQHEVAQAEKQKSRRKAIAAMFTKSPVHSSSGYAAIVPHDVENPLHQQEGANKSTATAASSSLITSQRPGVILSPSFKRSHPVGSPGEVVTNPMHPSSANSAPLVESTAQEIAMIDCVLRFRDHCARDVMTTDVFMLSMDALLDQDTLSDIFRSGYSRVPVFGSDRNDIVGLVLTKDLICLGHIADNEKISIKFFLSMFARPIICVWVDDKLPDVLCRLLNNEV